MPCIENESCDGAGDAVQADKEALVAKDVVVLGPAFGELC
jgi:hypothetical protein